VEAANDAVATASTLRKDNRADRQDRVPEAVQAATETFDLAHGRTKIAVTGDQGVTLDPKHPGNRRKPVTEFLFCHKPERVVAKTGEERDDIDNALVIRDKNHLLRKFILLDLDAESNPHGESGDREQAPATP
jgi:hypothetical protein